jgi:catechol 2,3-dioxygenase-like lactoylglutathione lyase family enzyme
MEPITGLGWVGTRTERYAETTAFFRDVLGLPVAFAGAHQAVFTVPGGLVEVFGPGIPTMTTSRRVRSSGSSSTTSRPAGPSSSARGSSCSGRWAGRPETGRWAHFRAPDGNVYELTSRPAPGPDRDQG